MLEQVKARLVSNAKRRAVKDVEQQKEIETLQLELAQIRAGKEAEQGAHGSRVNPAAERVSGSH
jgi:hypothetical protein